MPDQVTVSVKSKENWMFTIALHLLSKFIVIVALSLEHPTFVNEP